MIYQYNGNNTVSQKVVVKENYQYRHYANGTYDNLPESIHQLLLGSAQLKSCVDKLADFCQGQGVTQENYLDYKMNKKDSLESFLSSFCTQFAIWQSVYVHISVNLLGEPISYKVVPNRFVRKGAFEFKGSFAVWDNWNNQSPQVNPSPTPRYFFEWTNSLADRLAHIEELGEEHTGYIKEFRLTNDTIYVESKFMSVIEDSKADEGFSISRMAKSENSFEPTAFITISSLASDTEAVISQIQALQGADNDGAVIIAETSESPTDGKTPSAFNLQELKGNQSDISIKQEQQAARKIITAYGQPSALHNLDDNSLFSDSGALLKSAIEYYNMTTKRYRSNIQRWVNMLIDMHASENKPEEKFIIVPLSFGATVTPSQNV